MIFSCNDGEQSSVQYTNASEFHYSFFMKKKKTMSNMCGLQSQSQATGFNQNLKLHNLSIVVSIVGSGDGDDATPHTLFILKLSFQVWQTTSFRHFQMCVCVCVRRCVYRNCVNTKRAQPKKVKIIIKISKNFKVSEYSVWKRTYVRNELQSLKIWKVSWWRNVERGYENWDMEQRQYEKSVR